MYAISDQAEQPRDDLDTLRRRMVRELEEFLNRTIKLPLPKPQSKPVVVEKDRYLLN